MCITIILLQVIRTLTFQYCVVIRHSSPSWIQYWSNLVRFPSEPWLQTDSLGAKQTDWVMEEPEPELHKAMLIWIRMQFDSSPDWNRSKLNRIQWRVVLKVRLQIWFRGWLPVFVVWSAVSLFVITVCAAVRGCEAMLNEIQIEYSRGNYAPIQRRRTVCETEEKCCECCIAHDRKSEHTWAITLLCNFPLFYSKQRLDFVAFGFGNKTNSKVNRKHLIYAQLFVVKGGRRAY